MYYLLQQFTNIKTIYAITNELLVKHHLIYPWLTIKVLNTNNLIIVVINIQAIKKGLLDIQ